MTSYCGFNPEKDLPDLSGKVILITGGTRGVGKTALLHLAAKSPAHVYFTGRSQAAADSVLAALPANVPATFLSCDLTSLESIRLAAEHFSHDRLDIFIANAGVMAVDASLTKDGFEMQFGVNHIGNAALLLRLLPVMRRTAAQQGSDVRYVALTSRGYRGHPREGVRFASLRTTQEDMPMGTWGRYGQSKLANIVFAHEVARRYPEMAALAVHPGVVETELVTGLTFWKKMLVRVTNPMGLMTPEQGGMNTAWAAAGGDVRGKIAEGEKVAFFEPVGRGNGGDAICLDEKLGRELWEWTEGVVGVKA
ncbi:oxidoreductase [Thelonectria olida]|uniref:Oxidoreductase n=1 Tax=Thelonectria olida TaxID=1576542 RepID=A0A9P9AMI7_9HYPO|nr:oxidoreductase [Thelonectria olida]